MTYSYTKVKNSSEINVTYSQCFFPKKKGEKTYKLFISFCWKNKRSWQFHKRQNPLTSYKYKKVSPYKWSAQYKYSLSKTLSSRICSKTPKCQCCFVFLEPEIFEVLHRCKSANISLSSHLNTSNYRIHLNATPLLNRTSLNSKPNTTHVNEILLKQ